MGQQHTSLKVAITIPNGPQRASQQATAIRLVITHPGGVLTSRDVNAWEGVQAFDIGYVSVYLLFLEFGGWIESDYENVSDLIESA